MNLSEARDDISQFSSLSKFFLRELKPGLRPIGKGVISPVDGALTAHGPITSGRFLQAKGTSYSVAELIADSDLAAEFEGGYFVTIYLAPGDYHHVHAPIAGKVTKAIHVEGALWPVNQWSVANVENLFAINERITVLLEEPKGEEPKGEEPKGKAAVVFVGATNVGAIRLEHFDVTGNSQRMPWKRSAVHGFTPETESKVEKGGRLGSFCLGSTVVLLFQAGVFEPGDGCEFGKITLGTPISRDES